MNRVSLEYLKKWRVKSNRKPLIIRGARQVGKSHLVREFGREFESFLEINFERNPEYASLFTTTPAKTIELLQAQFNTKVIPQKTLLFLDEIQAAPAVLPKLRYFYEEMPDVHVISAGSLLEFLLEEHDFSMPVGRLEYLHLGPMNFEEFLLANGEEALNRWIGGLMPQEATPTALHDKAMEWVSTFLRIGGMPEAVKHYRESRDSGVCDEIKSSIINTFQDDFAKYRAKVDVNRLRKVYRKIPELLGKKLIYAHIDPEERAKDLSLALNMLNRAKICYKVHNTKASGLPLAAQTDDRIFKLIHLDVGLVTTGLGLGLIDFHKHADLNQVFQGSLTEQFVGQHLLYSGTFYQDPELYYWVREKASASAEVDFVTTLNGRIVPIEVKSGKSGKLRSLHVFMDEKKSKLAVRINSEPASMTKTTSVFSRSANFTLMSLPFYLVGQIPRLAALA